MKRFLVIWMLVCVACSPSAVERHTAALQVSHSLLDATAGGIEAVCTPDVDPERARKCLRAIELHDGLRAAWLAWAQGVAIADDEASWVALALALARLYGETAEAMRELGKDAPPLPAFFGEVSQ